MKTVVKKADDLRQGDLLDDGSLVVYVSLEDFVHMKLMTARSGMVNNLTVNRKDRFGVQVPEVPAAPVLTAAQQHAEELADLLDIAAASRRGFDGEPEWLGRAEKLLSSIKPPEPPTLAEALAELEAICNSHDDESEYAAMQRAGVLLDRARRAKVMPEGDRHV